MIFILLCLVFNFDLKSNIINNYFNFNDSLDSLQDSLIVKDKLPIDTNSTKNIDSLIDNRKSKNGLDTILTYTAKDTVVYSFKKRKMSMQGEVKIDYQNRNLNSETVDVDFIDNTFYANPKYDSLNKKYIGIPKFSEMGEAYAGAAIKYNYKTNRGLISKGETELGEGFYYGESIKRINETDFFIKNGYYTTCDDPDPHYYFGSSKMKMVANDQIYLDPLVFYVEDFPIFAVPFGLFFPTKSGRRSGLIVPSFFFSRDRGIVFENFGFYWAASDYYDMQLTSNIYTKGGYVLKNTHRWNLTDQYSGNANLEYGYTRFNPDSEYSQVWRFILSHNQTINPQERLNINLNLSSSDYNRNTSTNLRERIQQNITSNASYFINFDNQTSLSVSYNREQNIITDEYRQTLPITYNIPNIRLAKIMENDLNFSMRSSANYSNNKVQNIASNTIDDFTTFDSTYNFIENKNIIHNPNISYNFPKLWNVLNIVPSVNLNANNFFRKSNKIWNNTTNQVEETFENGFFTEYWTSYALNLQTRFFGVMDANNPLFGFVKPEMLGFKAFRHTAEPVLSLSYSKDNSTNNDFYGRFTDSSGKENIFSRFEKEGGSHAPTNEVMSMGFSLRNKFEMKIAQTDTIPDKNLELLQLDFNGNYNFALDSNKLSLINLSFRSPALTFLRLQGSATFDLMNYAEEFDNNRKELVYRRLQNLAILNGKSLARLNSFNISMSTDFSSNGIGVANNTNQDLTNIAENKDSISLGDRFAVRETEEHHDMFGDCSHGYEPVSVPWNVNLGLNYSYNKLAVFRSQESFSINTTASFDLTKSWKFNFDAIYDVVSKNFNNTTFNITKDLHCWSLTARWYPIGINQGFYLRFGIKASQLRDLQIEKQSSPLFR